MTARILITGSRTWTDYATMLRALKEWKAPGAVLVHGGAKGADRMAAAIWRAWGLTLEEHDADWTRCAQAAHLTTAAKAATGTSTAPPPATAATS